MLNQWQRSSKWQTEKIADCYERALGEMIMKMWPEGFSFIYLFSLEVFLKIGATELLMGYDLVYLKILFRYSVS